VDGRPCHRLQRKGGSYPSLSQLLVTSQYIYTCLRAKQLPDWTIANPLSPVQHLAFGDDTYIYLSSLNTETVSDCSREHTLEMGRPPAYIFVVRLALSRIYALLMSRH
jgi:hypothetical protein